MRLQALRDLGQSVWLDDLDRRLLAGGELARLIEAGVPGGGGRGAPMSGSTTSTPTGAPRTTSPSARSTCSTIRCCASRWRSST